MPTTATQLLCSIASGDRRAADDLLPLVYEQLHQLAEGYMRHERADHILQPTALVNEAYMKLVDQTQIDWKGRTHFVALAARAMQRVLVDHARARDRQKRGGAGGDSISSGASSANSISSADMAARSSGGAAYGSRHAVDAFPAIDSHLESPIKVGWRRVAMNDAFALTSNRHLEILALNDALCRMRELDERQARIAELKLFGEMKDDEIALHLDVSERTVERDWKMAKAWLRRELSDAKDDLTTNGRSD